MNTLKPSWKSGEFWLTLGVHVVSAVISAVAALFSTDHTVQAAAVASSAILSSVAQGTFNISRANVKAALAASAAPAAVALISDVVGQAPANLSPVAQVVGGQIAAQVTAAINKALATPVAPAVPGK